MNLHKYTVKYGNIVQQTKYENLYWNKLSHSQPKKLSHQPCNPQDLISNSPFCLQNDPHYVSLENLVLDQLVIP